MFVPRARHLLRTTKLYNTMVLSQNMSDSAEQSLAAAEQLAAEISQHPTAAPEKLICTHQPPIPTAIQLLTSPVAPKDPQYEAGTLTRASLAPSPFTQFHKWYTHALTTVPQPETTVLSTATIPSGRVASRTVYLKTLDTAGFVIFTNLSTSRKASDLATNTWCALNFHWRELEQQVRVEGLAEFVSRSENEEYFATRGRESQIGAHASRQSEEIAARGSLEDRVREQEEKWRGRKVECPEGWGGIRVRPVRVEFWQGRRGRLHDRFVYEREGPEGEVWDIKRLSP